MKKVLTIAGSDSGGGAGIQADLKTFAARGVYGMSVLTALTAQNTMSVQGIYEIPPEFIQKQIDSVMIDIGADVWKTGMLSNAAILKLVAKNVKKYEIENLVVDPVMVAKGGDALLNPQAEESLIEDLLPLAYIATPNHHEAQVLTRMKINNMEDAKVAAKKIIEMGVKRVILKGGRIPNTKDAIDIFYDGISFIEFKGPRINTQNNHGTGCTFASAIAAEMAKDSDIIKAIHIAKAYLTATLRSAATLEIGKGHGPVNHFLGKEVRIDLESIKISYF